MPTCKLCLKEAKLVESHIIPQSFYAPDSRLISAELPYYKKRPKGSYDTSILCHDCEGELNTKFDDYAKKVLIDRKGVVEQVLTDPKSFQTGKFYKLLDKKGYERIAGFFVSVLWRASVSSMGEFAGFNLGPYEERARQAIIDPSYPYSNFFSVTLCALSHLDYLIQLTSPKRIRLDSVNFYVMVIGSIKVFIRCDQRKAPLKLQPIILSNNNDVLMLETDVGNIKEHKTLVKIAMQYQKMRCQSNKKQ